MTGLALPIFRDRRQWAGRAGHRDAGQNLPGWHYAGKIPGVFAASAEVKGGGESPPLYAAGRSGLIAAGCAYSNAAGPNFWASVQQAADLAQTPIRTGQHPACLQRQSTAVDQWPSGPWRSPVVEPLAG